MRRYRQQPKFRLRDLFNKYTYRYWIIGGAVFLVALAAVLIWSSAKKLRATDTKMYYQEEIVIGISDSRFSATGEDGLPTGFDREVAEAIIGSVYPNAKLSFVVVPAEEASYQLKIGEIDLAMGTLTYNVLKTQGLPLSDGYFRDSVHAYVAQDSPVSIGGLNGGRVLIMTSELQRTDVRNALTEKQVTPETFLTCSSYPDAIAAVAAKTSSAVIAPKCKMEEFEHSLIMVEEPVCSISYRIAAWKTNSDAISILNTAIAKKMADGTIDSLAAKYGMTQYAPHKK